MRLGVCLEVSQLIHLNEKFRLKNHESVLIIRWI